MWPSWSILGSGIDEEGLFGGGLQANSPDGRWLNLQMWSDANETLARDPDSIAARQGQTPPDATPAPVEPPGSATSAPTEASSTTEAAVAATTAPPTTIEGQFTTYLRYCVWTVRPGDDGCEPTSIPASTATRLLIADVPVLSDWSPDGSGTEIPSVNGVTIKYATTVEPPDLIEQYSSTLAGLGWTISDLGSGSQADDDIGGGFRATNDGDGRFLAFQTGGPSDGPWFADLCVWPSRPEIDKC